MVTEIVLSNHNVSQSLRQKSFSLVPDICISKCGLVHQLSLSFSFGVFFGNLNKHSVSRFHLFIMFIASTVNQVFV